VTRTVGRVWASGAEAERTKDRTPCGPIKKPAKEEEEGAARFGLLSILESGAVSRCRMPDGRTSVGARVNERSLI